MRKQIITLFLASLFINTFFAFDWPLEETNYETINSEFAQLNGKALSSSLIYKEEAEVFASDKGNIIAIIDDNSDSFGWFESSLGSAVIISHNDGLSTVYANLNSESMNENISNKTTINAKDKIAISGNSAWQEENNGLEFKVFDKKNLAAVNPKILMPKISKEPRLEIGTVYFLDKQGNFHNIITEKKLSAETYYIYKTRQNKITPYKTIVAINGETNETIVYDTVKEKNGKLGLIGNNHYSIKEIYPDNNKQLLAKIQLSKGQNILTITLVNEQDTPIFQNYKLDAY